MNAASVTSVATVTSTVQRHPLDAVPCAADAIEELPAAGNGLSLRKERFPFGPRMAKVARKLGMRHFISFELDEPGAAFWKQIDGSTPLKQIAQTMAAKLSLSAEQARLLTVKYTRDLMLRGLITLKVDASPVHQEPNRQEV